MARRKKSPDKTLEASLASAEIFRELGPADLKRVAAAGKIERLKRGEVLFRTGDLPDRIHLVLDGAIEILRDTPEQKGPTPVAYLTRGEMIGDMALFTGSRRRSSARVPEGARLWTLLQENFEPLAETIPGLGFHLAKVFAHRLEELIYHHRPHERPKELAGRLVHFDLPTVVQTLASSGQTGILTIFDSDRTIWAEVLLQGGEIVRARRGRLEGEDAFYEIFMCAPDGEFAFRASAAPDVEALGERSIEGNSAGLLMEAMRLMDEVAQLKSGLPDAGRKLKTRTTSLKWDDEATADVVRQILTAFRKPGRLEDLVDTLPCSSHTFYRVASKLYEAGHIK